MAVYSKKLGAWLERLAPGESPPEGKKEVRGPKGGRYYVIGKEPEGKKPTRGQEGGISIEDLLGDTEGLHKDILDGLQKIAAGRNLTPNQISRFEDRVVDQVDRSVTDRIVKTLIELWKKNKAKNGQTSLQLARDLSQIASPHLVEEMISIGMGGDVLGVSDSFVNKILVQGPPKYQRSVSIVRRIHTDEQLQDYLNAEVLDTKNLIRLLPNLTESQLKMVEEYLEEHPLEDSLYTSDKKYWDKQIGNMLSLKKEVYENDRELLSSIKEYGADALTPEMISNKLKRSLRNVAKESIKNPSIYSLQLTQEIFNELGLGDIHNIMKNSWEESANTLFSLALRHRAGEMYGNTNEHSLGEWIRMVHDTDKFCENMASIISDRFEDDRFTKYVATLRNLSRRMLDISFPDSDTIKLWRGTSIYEVDYPKDKKGFPLRTKEEDVDIKSNPLSSWTLRRSVAFDFAWEQGNQVGMVLSTEVDKDDIFSYSALYANAGNEREFLLLNKGPRRVKAKKVLDVR